MNPKVVKILWIVLGLEIAFAIVCLVLNRAGGSLIIIASILLLLGGIGYISRFWQGHKPNNLYVQVGGKPPQETGRPNPGAANEMANGIKNLLSNFDVNLNKYPERRDVLNLTAPLQEDTKFVNINVLSGSLRLNGESGPNREVRIVATKRIWVRDEGEAVARFEKLQVRHWFEGTTLRIEAGDPGQGLVIGDAPRVDLEVWLPQNLATALSTSTGEILTVGYNGQLTAKSVAGAIAVENYSSGRNINLNSSSGQIKLTNVAAGTVHAKSLAGLMQLTGVGAEQIELETTAGGIRARGVNCGRFVGMATTGLLEFIEGTIEFGLELRTGAGRVVTDNVKANAFRLEATTGAITYKGNAPKAPSDILSGAGSVAVYLPPNEGVTLDARSNIGSVEVRLPITHIANQAKNSFQGQIAGGGAPLRITSQVGSVRVG